MPYDAKITNAGFNAAIAANNAGASVSITRVAVGTGRWNPTEGATALLSEVGRVPITRSLQVNSTTRQLDYRFAGSTAAPGLNVAPIGELGLFLADGTLFAIWSDTVSTPSSKAANTELRGSIFLRLGSLPAGSVTIVAQEPSTGITPQFGGFGGEGNLEITGTLTLSGRRRLNNFILRSGATLTVEKFLFLECSGEAIFEPGSTVNVLVASPGGAPISTSGSSLVSNTGFVSGFNFGASGGYAPTAKRYTTDLSPVGSGGQTGAINKADANNIGCSTGKGGDGAGALRVQARIGIRLGGTININGENAGAPTLSPNNVGTAAISGSAGGSGGNFWASTPGYWTIDSTSIINCNGGNGSDGIRTTTSPSNFGAAPGSGGSGGILELYGPNLPATIPGAVNVLGGLSGLYLAGNINTAVGSYMAGGTGGAFGNDALSVFVGTTQVRQNAGRIIALPILTG